MKKLNACVIGSGFGGLALAIRLQNAGYQTTLFEKRDLPGGRAYVFKDKGFTFDAGPTVVTAPNCIEELFEGAGRNIKDYVEMMPIMPFYRLYWEDGDTFDYSNDDVQMEKQIRRKSAQDWEGYKRFLKYSAEVFKEGYENLVHVPFPNFWSMIKVAPQLIGLESYRSVYSIVKKFVQDDHLRQAFSFHSLLVGGNPFTSSSIYTLIHHLEREWGVFFPKGGTGALVKAMVKLFTDIGGKIQLNAEVDRVLSSGGKVTGVELKSGDKFDFDLVACNSDVYHTYKDLLRDEKRVALSRAYITSRSYSMSLFLIYFGVKKRYHNIAHHNVIFGPRYRELLHDIFSKGVLADDFSLYLHAPTQSDPSLAPEGCETFYALSPVPHLGLSDIDWKKEGPVYAEKILNYLDQRYLPGLKENLVTQRIFTPLDFKSELNSHVGSAFSLEPLLTQSAYFRTQNKEKRLKGLYFVGAGTHPGAGIPGVVNSAKATFGIIAKDFPTEVTRSQTSQPTARPPEAQL